MLALARRERTRKKLRVWLGTPALAAAVLLLAFVLMARSLPTGGREPEVVASLVDKHLTYAQLEGPAEFSSTERPAVAAWFRQRTGLRVPVPDLSPAGIQLVGARIAEADQRKVAYLFYVKGHVLMSVFMVPDAGRHAPLAGGRWVSAATSTWPRSARGFGPYRGGTARLSSVSCRRSTTTTCSSAPVSCEPSVPARRASEPPDH
jgi:anti-sigma factor RsiW